MIVYTTAILRLVFSFSSFFYIHSFYNFEICCYLFLLIFSVFFSVLYLIHPSILFQSSFYSLFCYLSLFMYLFSDLLDCFPLKCTIFFSLFLLLYSISFSLMFYYYSICSLSDNLHLFRSLFVILLSYHFCPLLLFSIYPFFLVMI